jgi:formate dehydrogenase major subunit
LLPVGAVFAGKQHGFGDLREDQVEVRRLLGSLPGLRQVQADDPLGLGKGSQSKASRRLAPRTEEADRVVRSVCPYCAVGCGQLVYVKDEQVSQIEGDPDSPISRGRLCPKGSASKSLVTGPNRQTRVKYRRPYASQWEELPLEQAMEMIAERVLATRAQTWQEHDGQGRRVNRTLGFASLGGATLDNEENYLIKKLFTALGAIQIENQARI